MSRRPAPLRGHSLVRRAAGGVVAGAAGTLALDAVAWGDILVRGRPPSELPEQAAARMAGRVGVDLDGDDPPTRARRQALATLLGYATGASIGAAYAVVRPRALRSAPVREAALVAAIATAATAVPLTLQGLTDPRQWGVRGWLEDIVPHAAYGAAAAATLRAVGG